MKINLIKSKYSKFPLALLWSFLPLVTFAQADFDLAGSNFKKVILHVLSVIAVLIPILFAAAFIVFFWGLSKFILNSSSQAEIEKGKNYMIWGVLALFILISFRAIISLVSGEFELGNSKDAPQLPTKAIQNNVRLIT